MAREITIEDLGGRADEFIGRAEAGERITITRAGEAVALLVPARRRALSLETLRERRRGLPTVDPTEFRLDIASALDDTL
jgi:prevent-host-death family protein